MLRLSLLLLLALPQREAAPTTTFLMTELIGMGMTDQDVRTRWISYSKDGKPVPHAVLDEVQRVDRENLTRLKEIVEEFGWPTVAMVGKEGAQAAFLVVQHGVSDKPFMRKCLKLMKPLLESGEVGKPSYALLWDRTALQQGKKQRYGSQIMAVDGKWQATDVEDPANLDKRRATMGLGPMTEYLKRIEEMYGSPPDDH